MAKRQEIAVQKETTVGNWADAQIFDDTEDGNKAAHDYAAEEPNRRVIRRDATQKARKETVADTQDLAQVGDPDAKDGDDGKD
jgi:hypothetical protein